MKLVHIKTAGNRLADNQVVAAPPMAFDRKPVDTHLPNLMDKLPSYLWEFKDTGIRTDVPISQVFCNFCPELLAENEPVRFFLHRYLATHLGFGDTEVSKNVMDLWFTTAESANFEAGPSADWILNMNMRNESDLEDYFLEPFTSKTPTGAREEAGFKNRDKLFFLHEKLFAEYGTVPDAEWVEIFETLNSAATSSKRK